MRRLQQDKKSLNNSDYERRLKKFLIPILRRRSLWWQERNDAKRDAKVGPGLWKCKACKKEVNKVQMDHVKSVINVKTSWVSWDNFIYSLFCEKSNFAALCESCHLAKSQIENEQRKKSRIKRYAKK